MRAFGGLPEGLRAVVAVAATSLLMVVVAWATLIGPDEVFTGPGVVERTPTTTTRTCLPLVVTTAPDGTVATTAPDNPQGLPLCEEPDTSRQDATDLVEQADPPLWLKVLVWAFLLAVLLTVIALVLWVVANAVGRRQHHARERREAVAFTRVNLNESAEVAAYRDYDVVFCRNLLIYFDDASRRQAAESFFDVLRPGGFICLGHSESMSRISSLFRIRKFPKAIVYQKPMDGQ